MTNKEIRRQARSLYRQNIWKFLLAFLLMLAPGGVNLAVNELLKRAGLPMAGVIMGFIITVAAYPLSAGVIGFFYDEFHGLRSSVKSALQFYSDKKRLKYALILGAVVSAVAFILPLVSAGAQLLSDSGSAVGSFASMFVTLLALPVYIAQMILYCRLLLVPYIYAKNPEQKPVDTLNESFKKTKGHILEFIGFSFSIFWILFIPLFIIMIVMVVVMMSSAIAGGDPLAMMPALIAIVYLFVIPFGPYIQLCMSGFAARLMSGGKKPESEKGNVTYIPPKFQV